MLARGAHAWRDLPVAAAGVDSRRGPARRSSLGDIAGHVPKDGRIDAGGVGRVSFEGGAGCSVAARPEDDADEKEERLGGHERREV